MKTAIVAVSAAALFLAAASGSATGLATCDSGPKEGWKPQADLEKQLVARKWQVRRIKVDGGCYEVYGMNEKGEKVEAYFHPRTFKAVPKGSKGFKG